MKRNWCRCIIGFIVLTILLSMPFFAYKVKDGKGTLDSMAYAVPELRVPETGEASWAIKDMYVSQMGVDKFLSENSGDWVVFVDLRRGVPTLLDGGAIPIIPGVMNTLSWEGFTGGGCQSIQCLSRDKVEELAREFLDRYPGLFPVKPEELVLDPEGSMPFGESIYLLRFQWVVDGIPVEGASIFFRINNGNLLQVASTRIAPMKLDTTPTLSLETAWEILNGYLGDASVTEKDEIIERGKLSIIPITPKGMDPDVYSGVPGTQSGFVLGYTLKFRRPGVMGTWEAVIDAHTGQILRFVDSNRYGRIHGGVKVSDGLPPDADRPFPWADTGQAAPNNYSDSAGMFTGNNATSTLTGRYAHIVDTCGSISNTTTTGDLDFLVDSDSAHTDCDVPDGNTAGAGNTKSSRTLFYNLTAINLKAQTYAPGNTWLTSNFITARVNQSAWCNATSGGATVNFYQHVAGSCNNLGEIPGVAMHEWAHSYDTNDGSGGQSPPLETYSDWTAIIQTHNSCTGAGFLIGANCDGYGDACTDCSGVRDCDYTKHAANTPWKASNHTTGTPSPPTTIWGCSSGSYDGPCGWEDHCESGISTQALWDFVYTDLPAQCGMDITSAWMLEDRLWFAGVASLTTSYTCSGGVTDGCSGTVLYSVMRALDDDGDGTANGTPHAHAIFHAMDRHEIDCSTYNDSSPQNANQTSCPSLNTPTLSATGGNNSANLSWTTGGTNATRYFIFKNEAGCDVAFNRIAIVTAPTLTYTDTACANGVTYYYRVQAVTANDSCTSPSSNCVTVTPQPCTASTILDKSLYACASTVNVSVLDSTPGSSPWTATAWSTSDATPRSFTLTGTVPNLSGTFTTTTGTGGAGVVHVGNGDTLTVRFVDPDNCGGGSYNADATALIDCVGPVISNVLATNVTGSGATITWTTDEGSDSYVVYENATPPSANNALAAAMVTSHSVLLTGLTECTKYWFYVRSADPAGNTTTDDNSGAFYTFTTGKNVNPTYVSTDVPKSIPDNNTTGASSTVSVTDDKVIQDVNVTVTSLTHTFDGDIVLSMIGPDATTVILSNRRGSSGDNFTNTVFDDEASTAIASGTAPFTGSFIPDAPLTSFDGKNALGTWTFKVVDAASGDTGTIDGWSITFTYPAESCPSSEGTVEFDETVYGGASTMEIVMKDYDLLGTGSHNVEVFSTTETAPETVALTENPANSATFTGSFLTGTGAVANGDGHVTVVNGDTITVRYIDADDGDGHTNVEVTDTATVDMTGPVISDVLVTNVTPTSARITWTTTESSNSRVTYGTSTPPGVNQDNLASYVTSHTIDLSGLNICTTYYFSVTSADIYANSVTDDNGGLYYAFTTQGMSYAMGPDNVEGGVLSWVASGTAGSIWHQDTCRAASATHAWKAGASDAPTCTTQYGATVDTYLTWSSDITLGSAGHGYHLRWNEWYSTESCCDRLTPQISTDGGTTWTNLATAYGGTSTAWIAKDLDLASYTGSTVRLRFLFHSDGSIQNEGWYLDDIEISKNQSCSVDLVYQSRTMTEACSGTGSGGGNGILEPGEDATIGITMFNNGMANATGVSATLSSSTPGITVTTNTSSYPDISAGGTGVSTTSYVVHVDPSVTCVTTANFTLHSTSTQNPAGNDSYFTIDVGQAGGAISDFSQNFTGGTPPALPTGWTESHTSGNAWVTTTSYYCNGANGLYYPYNSSQAADSYVYTPGIALTAGVTYTLNFNQKVNSSSYPENFEVKCGTAATPAGQTITILASAQYTNTTCTLLSPTFTVPTTDTYYISWHCTSATDMYYLIIDDINLTHDTSPVCNVCTPSCTTPSTPAVGTITDVNDCMQSGINIPYTAGSPATSSVLVVDGLEGPALTGSPFFYNPGNSASHSYVVRTYNTASCHTDSAPSAFADANGTPSSPVLSGVTDFDGTCSLRIDWTPGSPSTSHELFVDGDFVAYISSSPYYYSPGDTLSHSFQIRTNNGTCGAFSATLAGADASCGAVIPGEVATGTNFTWSGQTMGWTADSNATGYRVYRGLLSNLSALCDATNDFCLRNDAASTSLDVTGDDPSGQSGRCYYYLITGYSGAGEGPAGTATCGARTINSTGGCS